MRRTGLSLVSVRALTLRHPGWILFGAVTLTVLATASILTWHDPGRGTPAAAVNATDFASRDPMDFLVRKEGAVPESRLISNYTGTFDGYLYDVGTVTVKTNADGFRDRTYSVSKPADTTRVIVLGDSFTFGWGVSQNQTYAALLEEKLNTAMAEQVQVLNFGVPGYDTREEVQILAAEGLKYGPDVVLVGYTTDEDLLPQNLTPAQQRELDRFKTTLDDSLSEEERTIKINLRRHELRLERYQQESLNTSWRRVLDPLRDLERLSEAHGFRVGIFAHTYTMPGQERKMQETADRFGWDVIDTDISHDEFSRYKLTEQDWHINAEGHRMVASTLYNAYHDHCLFDTSTSGC